ncbi:MAG: hybrid sensor histidine kinase/response regulator [Anaerolineae bacterium]|nr:hybrid sensor histidine kinase/response regulator [Anaerolineae bacterium]
MDTEPGVLVIDDELGIRVGCQRALQNQGYRVETAASGEEGLQKLQSDSYDLVLLDVMMPGISGLDVLDRISQLDPSLVCVVITGYATVELAVQAIKRGAYDFITKPFDADTLILTVEQGLEKRQLSKQAQRMAELEAEAEDLARQKKELERLDKIKSTFTLMVAHELRAPVAAIQSYLRLILDGYIPPEKQHEYLAKAERRALAQLELVNDLLDLARLQDPDVKTKTEPLQFDQVLEEIMDSMAGHAAEKDIHVEHAVESGLPAVDMTPQHARQLWTNLISNAVKYTPDGGRVTVSLSEQNGSLVGTVADTGIGIAENEIGLVFEEFYRSKAAKALTRMGTGLGLSIVKRIVETYHGTIRAESKVGQGTCFTFTLPVDRPSAPRQ